MRMLEQKHLALLDEAQRCGIVETGNLRACFELLALATTIDHDCASRLAPYRLSEGKFVLLFLLRGQPDGLAPHELADRAGVTRGTITGLLDGLEKDGYVIRQAAVSDRRKIMVLLTPKGQRTTDELFGQHSGWIASLFAGITAEERDVLNGLFRRIRQNLNADRKQPPQSDIQK